MMWNAAMKMLLLIAAMLLTTSIGCEKAVHEVSASPQLILVAR